MTAKNVLIVFAHPERKSLNGSLLDTAVEKLSSLGHNVCVSDLYQMNFNPVLGPNDIKGDLKKPDCFNWLAEVQMAFADGRTADDIQVEQHKLDAADLVIFQFPMYWFGLPAILKGWTERVLHQGYSAKEPDNIFEKATFKGKRAMLSFTTGGSKTDYSSSGLCGDIDIALWPIQYGTLRYVGFDVLAPQMTMSVYKADTSQFLKDWSERLANVFDEKPLHYLQRSDYENGILKTGYMQGEVGPTTGQHCGLRIPPASQSTSPK